MISEALALEHNLENDSKVSAAIDAARARLGGELVILGHHYESDAVLAHADLTGDSLKLSRLAASRGDARHIVFCGVDFMAQTADIITSDAQKVYLPHARAGCPMARMAPLDQVRDCWEQSRKAFEGSRIIPITYINSSAGIKAFCGQHGGAVCTSSNADQVLAWALAEGDLALFLPDQYLGANTARALGLSPGELCWWERDAGRLAGAGPRTKVILWDGYCPIHEAFGVFDLKQMRDQHPGIQVMVHPECRPQVVMAADQSGSTEAIIAAVSQSPAGSAWAIGTEINLVRRLAARHPDKTVLSLNESAPACADMARINPANLLAVLDGILNDKDDARVRVDPATAKDARSALDRMLAMG